MITDDRICTFYLDKQVFGVEVNAVQEVLRYQTMTEVPLAHQSVCGLINLRGQIVTAIDLRTCMQMQPRDPQQLPMNLIVRSNCGNATSFLVDRIGEVMEVDNRNFESRPGTLFGIARDLVRGAYKTEDNLILILDMERAMTVNNT